MRNRSSILACQKRIQTKEMERNEKIELDIHRSTTSKGLERDKRKSQSRISEKAQKAERYRLMKLAIDWNCVDAAREFLFKNSLDNLMVKQSLHSRYSS